MKTAESLHIPLLCLNRIDINLVGIPKRGKYLLRYHISTLTRSEVVGGFNAPFLKGYALLGIRV